MSITIVKDVDAVIKLKEKYPDRILLTRFETIAAHPTLSMKDIYEFIDLEFTQSIAEFVFQKTHSKTAGRGYSTDRTDSLGNTNTLFTFSFLLRLFVV